MGLMEQRDEKCAGWLVRIVHQGVPGVPSTVSQFMVWDSDEKRAVERVKIGGRAAPRERCEVLEQISAAELQKFGLKPGDVMRVP
jgi:hypothetical protein